jgi:predicted acyl esterase
MVIVEMGATSQVFLPGHRIRLDISSSNYPRFDPNPNTGERSLYCTEPVVAHQVIHFGGRCPSRLILPVVPN